MSLYAVILAGGKGERFWPKSKRKRPKQLIRLISDKTMIEETFSRITRLIPKERVIIVATADIKDSIQSMFPWATADNLLVEPFPKNTAPAIGYVATKLAARDKDATMVVLPSDHYIPEVDKFLDTVKLATTIAKKGYLVTFGIVPSRPETGYGYIEVGELIDKSIYKVRSFKEKPNQKEAQRFLREKRFLWNSGMFVWQVDKILEELKIHMRELYDKLMKFKEAIGTEREDESLLNLYEEAPKTSIDYGVMERAKNVAVVKATFKWDDVGSWLALERVMKKDATGNVGIGEYVALDTKDSIIVSDDGIIATVGVKDTIIIKDENVVLVCNKGRAQDIKKLVQMLQEEKMNKYL